MLLALFLCFAVPVHAVTPVQKVVALLKNLEVQLEEEGKAEAAQYDKYACFCKEQADSKLYAIESSTAKIEALQAKIGELDGEIADLNNDISGLSKKISGLEGDIANATASREAEHEEYLKEAADMSSAIDALMRAIESVKSSKEGLAGNVELEGAFAQLRTVLKSQAASAKGLDGLSALVNQPGEAKTYKYHSNEILATLESLLVTFREKKNELDADEFKANSFFEKERLGLQNEKKFAEKEKAEKEALVASKTEERETAATEEGEESRDKKADQSFLDVVKADCESKAGLWDQRSKTRAAELTSISDAVKLLESGVAPNWSANKKLVDLQTPQKSTVAVSLSKVSPAIAATAPSARVQAAPATSFLQLRGGRRDLKARRVLAMLSAAAGGLKSPILSALTLKVQAAADHFEKVRSLIKDLISKLEEDAKSEAGQKGFCDSSMAAAVTQRDERKAELEDLETKISSQTAAQAQLTQEVAALSEAIAQNMKALNEATELRSAEKAENAKTLTDAAEGKDAVEQALEILKTFYETARDSLLERQHSKRAGYVPPNSDREGKTLSDLSPEIFDANYKGAQGSAGGIMGLLKVILSDFERTLQTVAEQEKTSAAEFAEYEATTVADTNAKQALVETKESEISAIKDDLVSLQDSKLAATAALESAHSELETLHSMCVAGEETYEERVAKRQKEIDALKEAHAMLEDWQNQ